MLEPGGQTLSILLETDGLDRIAELLEAAVHVDIVATVTLDLAQVEAMAGNVGPVTVDLPEEARDRRTGFIGGPGPVTMNPEMVVAYLRSRTWEQRFEGRWEVITVTDEERIERLHRFLRAAIVAIDEAGVLHRLGVAVGLARNSAIHVTDPVAAAGFVVGAVAVRGIRLFIAPTLEERTIDERRSPFVPDDLGAARRLVLATDVSAPAGHVLWESTVSDGGRVDVFVSYRHREPTMTWVRGTLVPALEDAGLSVLIDVRDFVAGDLLIDGMESAATRARVTVAVVDETYRESGFIQFEREISSQLVAVIIADVPPERRPAADRTLDFHRHQDVSAVVDTVRSLVKRVFILEAEEDEEWVEGVLSPMLERADVAAQHSGDVAAGELLGRARRAWDRARRSRGRRAVERRTCATSTSKPTRWCAISRQSSASARRCPSNGKLGCRCRGDFRCAGSSMQAAPSCGTRPSSESARRSTSKRQARDAHPTALTLECARSRTSRNRTSSDAIRRSPRCWHTCAFAASHR